MSRQSLVHVSKSLVHFMNAAALPPGTEVDTVFLVFVSDSDFVQPANARAAPSANGIAEQKSFIRLDTPDEPPSSTARRSVDAHRLHEDLAFALRTHRGADDTFVLHHFNHTGGSVVADAQLALQC